MQSYDSDPLVDVDLLVDVDPLMDVDPLALLNSLIGVAETHDWAGIVKSGATFRCLT